MMIKINDYKLIFLSSTISELGSQFTLIAAMTYNYAMTGSRSALALTMFAYIFPRIIGYLFAGPLCDSYNVRKIMLYSDFLRILFVGMMIVAVAFKYYYMIYIAAFMLSLVSPMFVNSRRVAVSRVVDKSDIIKKNSYLVGFQRAAFIIGASLGGVTLSYTGYYTVFIIDIITYLISAILVYYTNIPLHNNYIKEHNHIAKIYRDYRDGLLHTLKYKKIWNVLVMSGIHQLACGLANVMYGVVVYAVLNGGEKVMGTLYSVAGVAECIAAMVVGKYAGRYIQAKDWQALIVISLLELVSIYQFVIVSDVIHLYIAVFFFSCLSEMIVIFVNSQIMVLGEKEYMGRMLAFDSVVFQIMYSIGMLIGGLNCVNGSYSIMVITICVILTITTILIGIGNVFQRNRRESIA